MAVHHAGLAMMNSLLCGDVEIASESRIMTVSGVGRRSVGARNG